LDDGELTRLRREKVCFIFQSFQLLQTMSVVENVELPLLLAGNPHSRPRALEALEAVGLAENARRMPHQLSGGQMQRVAIARALVHSPRLLLADEPTGNLDTTTGNSILGLMKRVCGEKKTTILMATHSVEAADFADAVIRMRDGRIEQIGPG
jgi:ABC-type lipoprotein export system ATPase subunit